MTSAAATRVELLPLALTVVAKRTLAERVVEFSLADRLGEPLPLWEPGSHIDVATPAGHIRQYSLCGDIRDVETWRIAFRVEDAGRGGSSSLAKLDVGDLLAAGIPRNNFGLQRAGRYIFIAGGIGITPILNMVAAAERRGTPWQLVYAGRTRPSMAYLGVAESFGDRCQVMVEAQQGRPDFERLLDQAPASSVYACGPPGMLDALSLACAQRPQHSLHVERFRADVTLNDAVDDREFDIQLASDGRVINVPADRSALESLEAAGLDVPFGCREGVCGLCLTPVISGQVEHRDFVLSADERASNREMTLCVSRCTGTTLVLDL